MLLKKLALTLLVLITQLVPSLKAQSSGSVAFTASSYDVNESDNQITIFVNRYGGAGGEVSIDFQIVGGSANSDDYDSVDKGTLVWSDGESGLKSFNIDILNDTLVEDIEDINLTLSNPTGGLLIGNIPNSKVVITGEESGYIGFATSKYITSEFDSTVEIVVTRGLGSTGAIAVDYEVLSGDNLDEGAIGSVEFVRGVPDENAPNNRRIERKIVPGVSAQEGSDFVANKGTLTFRDFQTSASFFVRLIPNLDGEAFPFTMAELALSNARRLDNESESINPVINEIRSRATLRINDVSGAENDFIWEGEEFGDPSWPDQYERLGFRFGKARYTVSEAFGADPNSSFDPNDPTLEIPVYRSTPIDKALEVGYMVGPNRGFSVNILNVEPAFLDARQRWIIGTEEPTNPIRWGDWPRILPNALTSSFTSFGSILEDNNAAFGQPRHDRGSLPQILLNPGSDLATPTGNLSFSPSHNLPIYMNDIPRDFFVTTGKLTWQENETEPKLIPIHIINDEVAEFNEDLIVILYNLKPEYTDTSLDEEEDVQTDTPDNGGDPDGDPVDEPEKKIYKPGADLGVQYWTTVTIIDNDEPAGKASSSFVPQINNDIYDIVLQSKAADQAESLREEKIIVVGDFTSIDNTILNRVARLDQLGQVDPEFNPGLGANSYVNAVGISYINEELPGGETRLLARPVLGGGFTSFDGKARKGIVRLNYDGSVDEAFNPGSGVDGEVIDVFVQQNNKIIIVGDFISVDGFARNSIARLNEDGTLDEGFDIGLGPDGPVYAVSRMPDGSIVVGGDFLYFGNIYSPGLVILNGTNGKYNSDFEIGSGVDGVVYTLDVDYDGSIIIGGDFIEVSGFKRNNIAKLSSNGKLDTTFNPGNGFDGPVTSLFIDKTVNVVGDPTFNLGNIIEEVQDEIDEKIDLFNLEDSNEIDYISSLADTNGIIPPYYRQIVQESIRRMHRVVIGGIFSEFNQTRRRGIVRINPDGTIDTSFMDTAYNHYAGLPRFYSTDPKKIINKVIFNDNDGSIIVGGQFDEIGGGFSITGRFREAIINAGNLAKVKGGQTWGPGNIEIFKDSVTFDESNGTASVPINRAGGSLGTAGIKFQTDFAKPSNGVATGIEITQINDQADYYVENTDISWTSIGQGPGINTDAYYYGESGVTYKDLYVFGYEDFPARSLASEYEIVSLLPPGTGFDGNGWMESDSIQGLNYGRINLIPDKKIEGNENIEVSVSNPLGLVDLNGEIIPLGVGIGRTKSRITIIDDDFSPGVFKFLLSEFVKNENDRTAKITVIREQGVNGTVSVDYFTNDNTALDGADYRGRRGTLIFGSGQSQKTFNIRLLDDEFQEGDEYLTITLTNPKGGALLSENEEDNKSKLLIIDNDLKSGKLELTKSSFSANESTGLLSIGVKRTSGSRGKVSVNFDVAQLIVDNSATSDVDFVPINGKISWQDGEVGEKIINVVINNDNDVEENEIFEVSLSDPVGVILGLQDKSQCVIEDDDSYGRLRFARNNYYVNENGGKLKISVLRENGKSGIQTIDYKTVAKSAAGSGEFLDFKYTEGTLTFNPDDYSQSFIIELINDGSLEGTEYFTVELGNINGGSEIGLIGQSNIYIIDDEDTNAPSGAIDVSLADGVGANASIRDIELLPEDKLIVSGGFDKLNNTSHNFIGQFNSNGEIDMEFNVGSGPNKPVNVVKLYQGSHILVGGEFDKFDNKNYNNLIRLNLDGSIDETFNIGSGANGKVLDIAIDTLGRIILVGEFTAFNGFPVVNIVRLESDGNVDKTFNTGFGADAAITSIALHIDDQILIGGDFILFDGVLTPGIARLFNDGSLDKKFINNLPDFDTSNSVIKRITSNDDGKIMAAGYFYANELVENEERHFRGIIRLSANGSIDPLFQIESSPKLINDDFGPNGVIHSICVQPDGAIILGGDFTSFHGRTQNRIVRLDENGNFDTTVNYGRGANDTIMDIVVRNDFKVLISGLFTEFGDEERLRIARVYGGFNYDDGTIKFDNSSYLVNENGKGDKIILRRNGGINSEAKVKISVNLIESISNEKEFIPLIDEEISFLPGQIFSELPIEYIKPEQLNDNLQKHNSQNLPILYIVNDSEAEEDQLLELKLNDFEGVIPGTQISSLITLVSDDAAIKIEEIVVEVRESTVDSQTVVVIRRIGPLEQEISVAYKTMDGTAISSGFNKDYQSKNGMILFEPGQDRYLLSLPIFDDEQQEGRESFYLKLVDPFPKGSAYISGEDTAEIVIVDSDKDTLRTQVGFATDYYEYYETDGEAIIKLLRTGDLNRETNVEFDLQSLTGIVGDDIELTPNSEGVTTKSVSFKPGEFEKNISVTLIDDDLDEGNETIGIVVQSVVGGSTAEIGSSTIEIKDFEAGTIVFSQWNDETNWRDQSARGKKIWDGPSMTDPNNIGDVDWNYRKSQYYVTENDGIMPWDADAGNPIAQYTTAPWFWGTTNKISSDNISVISDNRHRIGGANLGALITVTRVKGSRGKIAFDYATQDDTARAGEHYIHTQGSLVLNDQQLSGKILVPVLQGGDYNKLVFDPITGGISQETIPSASLRLKIFNVRPADGEVNYIKPYLSDIDGERRSEITANININRQYLPDKRPLDNVGVHFYRAKYSVKESEGSIRIRVNRGSCTDPQTPILLDPMSVKYVVGPRAQNPRVWNAPATPLGIGGYNQPGSNNFWIGNNSKVGLEAGSDFATPDSDFTPVTGTIQFQEGQEYAEITIPIINDDVVEFNEDLFVYLFDPEPNARAENGWAFIGNDELEWISGNVAGQYYAKVTIVSDDDILKDYSQEEYITITNPITGLDSIVLNPEYEASEQPAGSSDRLFNPDFQTNTKPPLNSVPGANDDVHSVALTKDGGIIIGGDFTSYNAEVRNRLVKLNAHGGIDNNFNIGTGANDFVSSVVVKSDGKILIGGGFTSYNGTVRYSIAKLNSDGSLDDDFDPETGANGPVRCISVQSDGKIIIGGEFTSFGNRECKYLARLNRDGSLDNTFQIKNLLDGPVYSLAIQPNGSILVGGNFNYVGKYKRSKLTRLLPNGDIDNTFESNHTANDIVYSILHHRFSNKIYIGGAFDEVNHLPYRGVARLNNDGSSDVSYDIGTGVDGTVFNMLLDDDGHLYIGGLFTEFNRTRRYGLARLYQSGILDTTFMGTAYNQFAGLYIKGISDPINHIKDMSMDAKGNLIIGGSFDKIGGGYNRYWVRNQLNVTRIIGGSTEGPGNIQLNSKQYNGDENINELFVEMERINGKLGGAMVRVASNSQTIGAGLAKQNDDFNKLSTEVFWPSLYWNSSTNSYNGGGWMRSDGYAGLNSTGFIDNSGRLWTTDENNLVLNIIEDLNIEGNELLNLELFKPIGHLYLGGERILTTPAMGRSKSKVSIIDNDFNYGTIFLDKKEYSIDEHAGELNLEIVRAIGDTGEVTVLFSAKQADLNTLNNLGLNSDQLPLAELASSTPDFNEIVRIISFAPGQKSASISVPIIDDARTESDEVFIVSLSNPTGGAVIGGGVGPKDSIVRIIDNDFSSGKLEWATTEVFTDESSKYATLQLRRVGGSVGEVSITYSPNIESSAIENVDFSEARGTVTWSDGEAGIKNIDIKILDNMVVGEDKNIYLHLDNPIGVPGKNPVLGRRIAKVNILNDDFFGEVSFTSADFYANENGGNFDVTVIRKRGIAESISVEYEMFNGSAQNETDYISNNGILKFEPGETSKTFAVQILDDDSVEGNESISIRLKNPLPIRGRWEKTILGTPNMATITIVDNETLNMPAGSIDTEFNESTGANDFVNVISKLPNGKFLIGGDFTQVNGLFRDRLARLNADGTLDTTFDLGLGIDGSVSSAIIQPDGRTILAGYFKSVDGHNRNGIARVNYDGSIDTTFNPGGGADNPILDIALQEDGKIIIVGNFSTFNGQNSNKIARLNIDGTIDHTFNVGSGADLSINDVVLQKNGKLLVVGDFKIIGEKVCNGIARLNYDGSIDTTFESGDGFNDSVRLVRLQDDGRILVGGFFTKFNSKDINRVIRLNANGSLDETFNIGSGANGSVYSMAVQSDHKILIGGSFTEFNGLIRNGIVRINSDGSIDNSINFGTGANGSILDIAIQEDYKIILGGGFTTFDGKEKNYIAQLHGGIIEGEGKLEFDFSKYSVAETGTNATIRVVRRGGLDNEISVRLVTMLSKLQNPALPNLDYKPLNEMLDFKAGENLRSIEIDIYDDTEVEPNEYIDLKLVDFSDGVQGNQSNSSLEIISDDSVLSFSASRYSVSESIKGGFARININRLGSTIGDSTVSFITATNGTAQAVLDFQMISNTIEFLDGEITKSVNVPIVDDILVEPEETVVLLLTNVLGRSILGISESELSIIDNDFAPGQFYFEKPTFRAEETSGFATITVVRTNGYTGLVELDYATSDLSAKAGDDYQSTSGKIVFGDGEISKNIDIPIYDDIIEEGAEALRVRIFNATGGGSVIPPNFATIIILDNELKDSLPGPKGLGANGTVYSVYIDDENNTLIGGDFNKINLREAPRLAKVDENGQLITSFNSGIGPNNIVYDIQINNSQIYIGGLFTKYNNSESKFIARLFEDGSIDESFYANEIQGTVYDINISNGNILVGGEFGLVSLNSDGTESINFVKPEINGDVFAVEREPNGLIIIAGNFTNVNGHTMNSIARLNSDGSADLSFDVGQGPNSSVNALSIDEDGVLIGGNFITVDGLSSRRIARLNFDGKLDRTFSVGSGFDGPVKSIHKRIDGRYLIGGSFGTYNDSEQNNITIINRSGDIYNNKLNMLGLNGTIYSLFELPGGSSSFGGAFTKQLDERGYNNFAIVDHLSSIQPAVLSIQFVRDQYELVINGEPNQVYSIHYSDNLHDWNILTNLSMPANGNKIIQLGPFDGNRYFRAVHDE